MFAWLKRLFGGGKVAPPSTREIKRVEKDRDSLEERRERLLYEAMELDEAIQALFAKYKETERDLLKKEIMRNLTIKRAEYESLSARLERLGEASVAHTRRSAFLQSFLDLPEITETDLDRLEELQDVRRDQERRAAIYADRVIGLTEMEPETSLEAKRLQRETMEVLEKEAGEAQKKEAAAAAAAKAKQEHPRETERKIAEALAGEADKAKAAEKKAEPAAAKQTEQPAVREEEAR